MYAGRDFSVSDGSFETEMYGFDFAPARNAPGDAVTEAVFTLVAVTGVDEVAQTRVANVPEVQKQAVSVQITALLPGVKYRLQAVATFASGTVLSLYSFIYSQALPSS